MKPDLEKAYDKVSWEFLDTILAPKGFGHTWRMWIRGCLCNTNFSIIINGKPRGKIHASRGLWQGDPLSPFLFTIVGDALSRSIQYCIERNILKGFSVGKNRVEVSMLQFTDDTLIFCPNEEEIMDKWWEILRAILDGASLSMNLTKTSIIGINLDDEKVNDRAIKMGCRVENFPINYLGFVLGGNQKRVAFWDPLVDKFKAKLDVWRHFLLSKGGRVTLVQSILNSIPIYHFSLLKAPKTVIMKLEKIIRDFVWSGGSYKPGGNLIKWEWTTLL